jgi:FlaA1/EpsC-like NDP-sugar epimerase
MHNFDGNPPKFKKRKIILILLDACSVPLSGIIGLFLALNLNYIPEYYYIFFSKLYWFIGITIAIQWGIGSYNSLWRYASVDELIRISLAAIINTSLVFGFSSFVDLNLPNSFYFAYGICLLIFTGGTRFAYRVGRRLRWIIHDQSKSYPKIMIIGAGKAGIMVLKEMRENPTITKKPVAFLDDDTSKHGMNIMGVKVLGGLDSIHDVAQDKRIQEIIIAIPSTDKKHLSELAAVCIDTGCKVRMLPSIGEIIDGRLEMQKIRDVEIKDLLGREEVQVDLAEMSAYIHGKCVLVTGGGGSIGSELCRQIVRLNPSRLVIVDNYENNAYDIQLELQRKNPTLELEVIIASVREAHRINEIFNRYRPHVVFHAAAHKHVPLMEHSPAEAIKNNVFGTHNVVRAADQYGAERFVLISTDKAVNPTNVMGATKRVAETIIQAYDKVSKTDYVAVRFGNVLGSNGSVIPLFKKQIEAGGPVTVTDPEMLRYFMTIPEAVQLVIQAGAMAQGGEIFVLDMGEPVKILTLAEKLIKLSGFEPYKDIDIHFTGLRPGEKLYEELLMAEEGLISTKNKRIFVGKPGLHTLDMVQVNLNQLGIVFEEHEGHDVMAVMGQIVPTYVYKLDS